MSMVDCIRQEKARQRDAAALRRVDRALLDGLGDKSHFTLFPPSAFAAMAVWAGINSAKPGQPVINIMMMMSIWTGLDHVPTDCRSSEMPILLHIVWTWTPTLHTQCMFLRALTEEVGILGIYQETTNCTQIFDKRWQKSYDMMYIKHTSA